MFEAHPWSKDHSKLLIGTGEGEQSCECQNQLLHHYGNHYMCRRHPWDSTESAAK